MLLFESFTSYQQQKKNFASMAAIYFGARYIERHITILEPNMTKDGIVSIKPEDIKKIKYFAQLEKSEMKIIFRKL